MSRTDEILSQALALPNEARAQVALRLLESLPEEDDIDDETWIAEIKARAQRAVSGASRGSPWPEVKQRIEEALKQRTRK